MLTGKQENFCIAFVELSDSQAAYKRAYPASEKWNPNTLRSKAGQMFKNGAILARIEELRAPLVAKASCSFDEHMARLDHLSRMAESDEEWSAAITAETNRGKAAGHYIDRQHITGDVVLTLSNSDARL